MGCYGIGVSRLLATIIEKNNDEGGIIWPKEITPFDAEILPLQVSDKDILQLAYDYEKELSQSGIDVLTDDREESPGKKFNDADLIGIPYRIMIGKRMFAEGKVEIKDRRTGEVIVVAKEDAVKKMKEILK